MNYYFFLKQQSYIFLAAACAALIAYAITRSLGFRGVFTVSPEFIVAFFGIFIFFGAFLRYKKHNERKGEL